MVISEQDDCDVSMVQFGIGEVTFVLSGVCVILVVPAAKTPGQNLAQKVSFIESLSPDELVKFRDTSVDTGAVFLSMGQGDMVAIPPNTLVVQHAEQPLTTLRWGTLPSDAMVDKGQGALREAVAQAVSGMFDTYGEDLDETYAPWYAYIKKHMTL